MMAVLITSCFEALGWPEKKILNFNCFRLFAFKKFLNTFSDIVELGSMYKLIQVVLDILFPGDIIAL